LQRKSVNRLGYNGIHELRNHPWLNDFNWKGLYEKTIISRFIPRTGDNFDKRYCEGLDKIGNDTLERYQTYIQRDGFDSLFVNYTFYGDLIQKEKLRIQSRLANRNSIEAYNTKNKQIVSKKKLNFVNNNSLSNLLTIKHQASPIPVSKESSEYTPVIKTRQQSGRSIISSSLFKEETPVKYAQSTAKILGKLPNIDFKRFNIKKLTESQNSNIFKRNRNTISIDTGSTNTTLIHKRTLSNFTKKI
jgi:hypothetical protein